MADRYDLVIIGMGSGGIIAAEFAASIGLRVAVVERHRVGGDCLWTGCVPSKALIATAKTAHTMRHADRYGLTAVEPTIDLAAVWARIRVIQHDIASTDDNPDTFSAHGVEIHYGNGRLTGPNSVSVTDDGGKVTNLGAKTILICTGSRPVIPAVEGLAEAKPLTSETLWDIDAPPHSMVVIGGGPIGIELSQAMARLGITTTVLQHGDRILPRDEPELVAPLQQQLADDGVDLRLNTQALRVEPSSGRHTVHTSAGPVSAEGILVAAGRKPNIEDLGLEELGITTGPRGVEVDDCGRTSVHSIYAAGDVAGRYLFTHAAGHEAVRAVRDAFYPGRGKVTDLIPWCTFTDPELAHAGLTSTEASATHGADKITVWRHELTHSDRARADGTTRGGVVIVAKGDDILGAHILAPHAGDMISELALAISAGLGMSDLSKLVHPYPTLATGIGQIAAEAAFGKAQKYRWLVRR